MIASAGGRAAAFRADTSVAADVDRAVTEAVRLLGPLEIMVNNAGILDGYFDVDEMSEAVWRARDRHRPHRGVSRLQARGGRRCCRAAAAGS